MKIDVQFFRCNVLDMKEEPPHEYDIMVNTLFMHHLTNDQAVGLLETMSRYAQLVIINDLRRSLIGWMMAVVGTRILSRSPVVHVDGPRSVQAAFTTAEMQGLARRADMNGVQVRPVFPQRQLLTWRRSA